MWLSSVRLYTTEGEDYYLDKGGWTAREEHAHAKTSWEDYRNMKNQTGHLFFEFRNKPDDSEICEMAKAFNNALTCATVDRRLPAAEAQWLQTNVVEIDLNWLSRMRPRYSQGLYNVGSIAYYHTKTQQPMGIWLSSLEEMVVPPHDPKDAGKQRDGKGSHKFCRECCESDSPRLAKHGQTHPCWKKYSDEKNRTWTLGDPDRDLEKDPKKEFRDRVCKYRCEAFPADNLWAHAKFMHGNSMFQSKAGRCVHHHPWCFDT